LQVGEDCGAYVRVLGLDCDIDISQVLHGSLDSGVSLDDAALDV